MYSNYCTRSEFQSNRVVSAFEVCVSMSNRFQLVDVTLAQNDSGRLRSKVSRVSTHPQKYTTPPPSRLNERWYG